MTDYIKLNQSALTFTAVLTILYVVLVTALLVAIGFAGAWLVGIPVSFTWYAILTSVWVADIFVTGRHKMTHIAFSRALTGFVDGMNTGIARSMAN